MKVDDPCKEYLNFKKEEASETEDPDLQVKILAAANVFKTS